MSDNMEILIICHLTVVSRLGVLHFYQKIALPIKLADLSDMLKKGHEECPYIDFVVSPEPDDPEPADDGDIQMEYSFDYLYRPCI